MPLLSGGHLPQSLDQYTRELPVLVRGQRHHGNPVVELVLQSGGPSHRRVGLLSASRTSEVAFRHGAGVAPVGMGSDEAIAGSLQEEH